MKLAIEILIYGLACSAAYSFFRAELYRFLRRVIGPKALDNDEKWGRRMDEIRILRLAPARESALEDYQRWLGRCVWYRIVWLILSACCLVLLAVLEHL